MAANLPQIIRHYRQFKNANPDTWKAHCQSRNNLHDAIHFAALCRDASNRKHPHQYRLPISVLSTFETQLLNQSTAINSLTDFDALYRFINSIKPLGVGILTAYDVAIRIAAFLSLEPTLVYLHAGTRTGAEKLLGRINADVIPKSALPNELKSSQLTCYELEDLLCIYKDRF